MVAYFCAVTFVITVCDVTCASCTVAQNPAFCQSCVAGRMLNGNSPTSCVLANNPCNGSTYLSSSGECTGMYIICDWICEKFVIYL